MSPTGAILACGVVLWLAPLLFAHRGSGPLVQVDRRARWGLALQCIAYALLFPESDAAPPFWRTFASLLFFGLAALLSFTSVRALGRHLRFDAAIGERHQLVSSGPYRVVRHPIYASMLCLLLGAGFLLCPIWRMPAALILFIIGTEIRVRIEDRLLSSRFGATFQEFKRRAPAYVPSPRSLFS